MSSRDEGLSGDEIPDDPVAIVERWPKRVKRKAERDDRVGAVARATIKVARKRGADI